MGDHFVLLVDRLLTESTLEAAIGSKNCSLQGMPSAGKDDMIDFSTHKMDENVGKLAENRICHDEDEDLNMETPCSCRGSLKYAHRKCVQRWCNEKGDIICEICHQEYRPNYTAPPPLFHYGGVPMNFRGNWEISRRDLHAARFMTMVTTDRDSLDSYFDDYSPPSSSSLICCRLVAITFMVLLVLRHTLPIIINGAGDYSITLFTLLMLRTIGILLPIYVIVKAFTAIQRRRHHQDHHLSPVASNEESDLPELQPQSRFIRIH